MKRTAILAAALVMLAACAQNRATDPVETAIKTKIAESVSPDAVIRIDRLEKVDSTTFGSELEHRIKVFTLRHDQNEKYYFQYNSEGRPNSAAEKKEAMKKDALVLEGLDKIGERMADSLSLVAYYDYKFSGSAETKTERTVFQDYYASITSDGQVMSISSSTKGLHKSLGRVIPGYTGLIGKDLSELLEESDID